MFILISINIKRTMIMMMIIHQINTIPRREEIKKHESHQKSRKKILEEKRKGNKWIENN